MEVRNILISKLGVPDNYECVGNEGDHGVYDAKDFTLEEVKSLKDIDITPELFQVIYDKYIDDITKVIKRNPYMKIYSVMDEGEMSEFSELRIKEDFAGFMSSNNKLNSRNKIVLKNFIELLDTYSLSDLLEENSKVKKELENGVFDLVKNNAEALSKEEREKINKLDWKKEDVDNYFNLRLLSKRLNNLKQNGNVDSEKLAELCGFTDYLIRTGVPNPKEISNFNGKNNVRTSDFYSRLMQNIYDEFEILNREDIIKNLYCCNDNSEMKKEEIPENMLLHFYEPGLKKFFKLNFANTVINRNRFANNEEILPTSAIRLANGKIVLPNYPELEEKYKEQIENENLDECVDELKPDKTFNITEEDIKNNLGYRLDVLKSDQLACTTIKKDTILKDKSFLRFAVGFGKSLNRENILLSCVKNADSNLGFDNIPYKNKFLELSNTFNEIQESNEEIKEILLNRENLKADYLFCIYNQKEIDSLGEDKEFIQKQMQEEIENAKKLGIAVKMLDLSKTIDSPNVAGPIR